MAALGASDCLLAEQSLAGGLPPCVSHRQLGLLAQGVFMWGVCEGYCSPGLGPSCFQAAGKLQALKTLFILSLAVRAAQKLVFLPAPNPPQQEAGAASLG